MKKILFGLALAASLALGPKLSAEVMAVVNTSSLTVKPFSIARYGVTPATYTAGSVLGPGTVLTKLWLSAGSAGQSHVQIFDSPDGTTYAAQAYLKLDQWYYFTTAAVGGGPILVDFVTAKSQRSDSDGLEFKGFPLLLTQQGVTPTASVLARKGAANTVVPY